MKPLIIIGGPTASGKSDISIELCQKFSGNVISADSIQVYKMMDIGSAKLMPEEMKGIKHYGIDILDPHDDYNINLFQRMAKEAIKETYSESKLPFIVGGTGFYIQSVLYDIDFADTNADLEYRQELQCIAENDGPAKLHEMLKDIDSISYEQIHFNNVKRVIRALEYYKQTGTPISLHNIEERSKESPYNYLYFVLTDQRELLYKRIDERVNKMIDRGLVDEVQRLMDYGIKRDNVSMQGLGYKEIFDYLTGITSLEEAIEKIKQESRRFAKRQLTWFRREKSTIWIDRSTFSNQNEIVENMSDYIKRLLG